MRMYAIKSWTNYGETVMLVNAENIEEVNKIVKNDGRVWDDHEIEEVDTKTLGIVFFGGGDSG